MLTDWEQPVRTHHGDSLLNSIVTTCLQERNSLRVFTCVVDVFKVHIDLVFPAHIETILVAVDTLYNYNWNDTTI